MVADDECDLILALITGDAHGEVTTAQLRGFLQGYSRGFLYDDPDQKRTMFPADCVTPAPQLELPQECAIGGACVAHLNRDVVSQPRATACRSSHATAAPAPWRKLGAGWMVLHQGVHVPNAVFDCRMHVTSAGGDGRTHPAPRRGRGGD